jgi:hypothetical protein
MSLVDHFERALGLVHAGWSRDGDGADLPFQIVRFAENSGPNSVGYATLGLSRYPLTSPTSGKSIRQELLFLAPAALESDTVVSLLLQVGSMALDTGRALLRGDVIGPAGEIVPGSEMTALYVTMPVYFPDEFGTYADPDGDIVVAWMVPISDREAAFVAQHGWEAFEDRLVEADPDLVDIQRPGLKL